MSGHNKKKRSRSRSKDDHRRKRKQEEKIDKIEKQLDNLKEVIEKLVQVQKEQSSPNQSAKTQIIDSEENKENSYLREESDTEIIEGIIQEKPYTEENSEELTLRDNVLKALGVDLNESKFKEVEYHPELKNTWSKWMKQGLPEKNKKEILELYNRKGELYTEAPKINLEIIPLLSEIAKKRDQHFLDTQNCVGTALAALGAAVSMLVNPSKEGLDEDVFTDYLSHAGQILTDVFYQQAVARKSFITPQLNKNIKPTVEAMISDEWLYGNNLKDKVKDAKEIEKACAEIKERTRQKNPSTRLNRGNWKYPPASYRQVGHQQKHRQLKFKKKVPQNCSTEFIQDEFSDEPIIVQEIRQVDKPAGRLRFFMDNWRKITTDKYVLGYIEGYQIPFIQKPFQKFLPKRKEFYGEELRQMQVEINKLLRKGAIEECEYCEDQFLSSYFLVPKPDGSNRFIFNLKELNKFIDPPHFKLENINSALNLVSPRDFMGSLDLKDAYFVVPIYKKHKKFLRFEFEGKLFQFTCLPFGLCTSPYVFTKLMKPIVNKMRSEGMLLVLYLDDFLFIHGSKSLCEINIKKSIKFLQDLGFVINLEKSSITASQRCKYLGFVIDSVKFTLNLTDKKKNQIIEIADKFKIGNSYKIRKFAEFLGILAAACPAVSYGFIHCKRLERQKFLALKFNGGNYNGKIYINENMMEDLSWWKINAAIGSNPIRMQKFCMEIYSDASLSGWGCYCNGISAFGFWNKEEKKRHINYLELLAAFFALKCFVSNTVQKEVLLRLDNTTAISYVNRAAGVQFLHLSELAREIWKWCEKREIWLRASYISSIENVEADRASRNMNVDTEWELSLLAFEQIEKRFGPFSIDLFASRLNKKCNRFYSRFPDPESEAVDAFTRSWKDELFYAFPPFALILRTLRKIINDGAIGTLVKQQPSVGPPPFVGGRQIIRTAFLKKGVSEDSVDVMVNSVTSSTLKQYECSLKHWWNYTQVKNLDIYNTKTSDIIDFLNNRFRKGAKYSSLNTARATISLISVYDINKDGLISRFLKGVFKQKPTSPKYNTTWDITPVLNYIEKLHPLNQLKLRDATEKVATLLALTTAQRLQTLALINIKNIAISNVGISIKITEQIKTTRPGSFQPELILPFYKNKPGLCVASAILEYVKLTKDLRDQNTKNLLITTMKPYKAASAQTISHWIKALLSKACIDTKQFTAYSTRHAAVSTAHKRGVNIDVIKRSAGWTPGSQTFFKFYNRAYSNSQ